MVEAFPSGFLGVMLKDPAAIAANETIDPIGSTGHLTTTGVLRDLLGYLLPGRAILQTLSSVTNHDDRAALVCALTAMVIAAGDFTAVGNADGWIVLPPRSFVQEWARDDLKTNARDRGWEAFTKPLLGTHPVRYNLKIIR